MKEERGLITAVTITDFVWFVDRESAIILRNMQFLNK